MAIGATAQFEVSGQLDQWQVSQKRIDQVHTLAVVELWVATAVIGYVCLRFVRYAWVHWSQARSVPADDN